MSRRSRGLRAVAAVAIVASCGSGCGTSSLLVPSWRTENPSAPSAPVTIGQDLQATALDFFRMLKESRFDVAWTLLSVRCRAVTNLDDFARAEKQEAWFFRTNGMVPTISVRVSGLTGTVTMNWPRGADRPATVPWIAEAGRWWNDSCS